MYFNAYQLKHYSNWKRYKQEISDL